MTLKEAKEEIVRKRSNSPDYRAFYLLAGFPDIIKVNDEASELYARSKWDEACEAQKRICNEMLQEPGRKNVNSAPKPEFKP